MKNKQIKLDLRKIDKNKMEILTEQFVNQMGSDANSEVYLEKENLCLLAYMEAFIASYLAALGALPCLNEDRLDLFRKMVGHLEAKIPELDEWSVAK
jgi:hypothetical protein